MMKRLLFLFVPAMYLWGCVEKKGGKYEPPANALFTQMPSSQTGINFINDWWQQQFFGAIFARQFARC